MARGLPYLRLIMNTKMMFKFTDPSMKKNIMGEKTMDLSRAQLLEIVRGLFGKDANVTVKHTKNLNRGDECCEVVVSM